MTFLQESRVQFVARIRQVSLQVARQVVLWLACIVGPDGSLAKQTACACSATWDLSLALEMVVAKFLTAGFGKY
jgi:hypothetical protein